VAYDFLVWLFGSGIAALIAFLPVELTYTDNALVIEARLSNPVTEKTRKLVRQGLVLTVDYDCTVIINDANVYRRRQSNGLCFRDSTWKINECTVGERQIQTVEGSVRFKFESFRFDEGDEMLVFLKASIAPDSLFTLTTGLKTGILWNHYEPRCEKKFVFTKGSFSEK
jgi:hypothetical protein